jgi:hypothetical protein
MEVLECETHTSVRSDSSLDSCLGAGFVGGTDEAVGVAADVEAGALMYKYTTRLTDGKTVNERANPVTSCLNFFLNDQQGNMAAFSVSTFNILAQVFLCIF